MGKGRTSLGSVRKEKAKGKQELSGGSKNSREKSQARCNTIYCYIEKGKKGKEDEWGSERDRILYRF